MQTRCRELRAVIVDLFHFQGMFLDEVASWLDFLAHQDAKHFVGLESVFEMHLHKCPFFWVQSRFP